MSDAATILAWTLGGAAYGAALVVVLSRLAGDAVCVPLALGVAVACAVLACATASMGLATGALR